MAVETEVAGKAEVRDVGAEGGQKGFWRHASCFS